MEKQPFDVFLWANEIDEVKNNVSAELFLFNKNYTPYKIKYSDKLTNSVKSMFMNEAIKYIIEEADSRKIVDLGIGNVDRADVIRFALVVPFSAVVPIIEDPISALWNV